MMIWCDTCGRDYESLAKTKDELKKYGQTCPSCLEWFKRHPIFDCDDCPSQPCEACPVGRSK